MRRQQLQKDTHSVNQYRLYKSHKRWLVAGVTFLSVTGGGLALDNVSVHADVTPNATVTVQASASDSSNSQIYVTSASAISNDSSNGDSLSQTSAVVSVSSSATSSTVNVNSASESVSTGISDAKVSNRDLNQSSVTQSSFTSSVAGTTTSALDNRIDATSFNNAPVTDSGSSFSAVVNSLASTGSYVPDSYDVAYNIPAPLSSALVSFAVGSEASAATVDIYANGVIFVHDGNVNPFELASTVSNAMYGSSDTATLISGINSYAVANSLSSSAINSTLLFSNAHYSLTSSDVDMANYTGSADPYAYGLSKFWYTTLGNLRSPYVNDIAGYLNVDFNGMDGFDKITNLNGALDAASLLNLNLGSTFNTPHLTTMTNMLQGSPFIHHLDLGTLDTHNVVDMSNAFPFLPMVRTINLGPNFNTQKVTNMSNMFGDLGTQNTDDNMGSNPIDLDLGNQFYTSQVTLFDNFLSGSFHNLNLGNHFTVNVQPHGYLLFLENNSHRGTMMNQLNLGANFNVKDGLANLIQVALDMNANVQGASVYDLSIQQLSFDNANHQLSFSPLFGQVYDKSTALLSRDGQQIVSLTDDRPVVSGTYQVIPPKYQMIPNPNVDEDGISSLLSSNNPLSDAIASANLALMDEYAVLQSSLSSSYTANVNQLDTANTQLHDFANSASVVATSLYAQYQSVASLVHVLGSHADTATQSLADLQSNYVQKYLQVVTSNNSMVASYASAAHVLIQGTRQNSYQSYLASVYQSVTASSASSQYTSWDLGSTRAQLRDILTSNSAFDSQTIANFNSLTNQVNQIQPADLELSQASQTYQTQIDALNRTISSSQAASLAQSQAASVNQSLQASLAASAESMTNSLKAANSLSQSQAASLSQSLQASLKVSAQSMADSLAQQASVTNSLNQSIQASLQVSAQSTAQSLSQAIVDSLAQSKQASQAYQSQLASQSVQASLAASLAQDSLANHASQIANLTQSLAQANSLLTATQSQADSVKQSAQKVADVLSSSYATQIAQSQAQTRVEMASLQAALTSLKATAPQSTATNRQSLSQVMAQLSSAQVTIDSLTQLSSAVSDSASSAVNQVNRSAQGALDSVKAEVAQLQAQIQMLKLYQQKISKVSLYNGHYYGSKSMSKAKTYLRRVRRREISLKQVNPVAYAQLVGSRVQIKRTIYLYRNFDFKAGQRMTQLRRGQTFTINGVQMKNGVARLIINNGHYITANVDYVRIIK